MNKPSSDVYAIGFQRVGARDDELLARRHVVAHNDILRYLILMMNFGFVMTLNPFFKFPGAPRRSDA